MAAHGIAPFKFAEGCVLNHGIAPNIPYWILFPDNYKERFTRNEGNSVTVRIVVQWEDAPDFKKFACGFSEGYAGGLRFNRQPPLLAQWANNLYLSDLNESNVGNFAEDENGPATTFENDPLLSNWPSAGWVAYDASFVSLNYPILADRDLAPYVFGSGESVPELQRYVRKTERTIPKERKLPSATFQIDGTTTRIDEVAFVPVYEKEIIYNWMEVPFDLRPQVAMTDKIGKVNSQVFDGYAVGTMLYKGVVGESEPYVGPSGEKYINIAHNFGYRPTEWNKIPVGFDTSGGPVFVYIQQAGASAGQRRPYASTTFAELFRPKP